MVVEMCKASEDAQRATGRFDGSTAHLLRALQEGHWLMLDNANLCSASVLDRLNSLFEVNGSLVISERGVVDGKVPVVRPHPNFRVFMCLDPRHGELSRAMRIRGIEIALLALRRTQRRATRRGSTRSAVLMSFPQPAGRSLLKSSSWKGRCIQSC